MSPFGAERTARFILTRLQKRFPNRWLGAGHSPNPARGNFAFSDLVLSAKQMRRLQGIESFCQLFEFFSLQSIARDSHLGLTGWLQNRYPLILLNRIPSPHEMLKIQCQGQRYVTLLEGPEWEETPIGRHRGALEFLLHDLEHAHKFFGNKDCHVGQLRFFQILDRCYQQGWFDSYIIDKQFRADFHYLISDMNSHPVHLLKFLKAIVLNAGLRQTQQTILDLTSYWERIFSEFGMSQNETLAALKINNPDEESPDARKTVAAFFILGQKSARIDGFANKNDSPFSSISRQM